MPNEIPAWLNSVADEKLRASIWEEAQKEFMPKADFTRYSQGKAEELNSLQAQVQQLTAENQKFNTWYHQMYEPWAEQVKPILESYTKNSGPQRSQTSAPDGDWAQNWDVLTPQQQAQALRQELTQSQQQIFQDWSKQFATSLQNVLADRERYYQDYLSLYIDANEKKRLDPELDIPAYMKRAMGLKTGQENPLETAYTLETLEREKKKWLEQGRQHGKQEAETEFQSRRPPIAAIPTGPEPYKPKPTSQADRMSELKQKIAEKYPQAY